MLGPYGLNDGLWHYHRSCNVWTLTLTYRISANLSSINGMVSKLDDISLDMRDNVIIPRILPISADNLIIIMFFQHYTYLQTKKTK